MYRSGWDRLDLLRRDFERLLDELTAPRRSLQREPSSQSVPLNVFETDTELVFVAAMPGMERDNIDIAIDNNRITIRGDQRGPGQEHMRYLTREWSYGPYERTVELPPDVDVDGAKASYGNGVVTLAFPRAAAKTPRKIEIKPEERG